MTIRRELQELRDTADKVLEEHSPLTFHHGHAGAAHCPCEVAERWREADTRFWAAKGEVKSKCAGCAKLESERQRLREALLAAVPFLFEHGRHMDKNCYRGSDDGCYCGLTEAKQVVEKALGASPGLS